MMEQGIARVKARHNFNTICLARVVDRVQKKDRVSIEDDRVDVGSPTYPQEVARRSGEHAVCRGRDESRIEMTGEASRLPLPIDRPAWG